MWQSRHPYYDGEGRESDVFQAETKTELPVKCPKCGFENAAGVRFCGSCGRKLQVVSNSEYVEALAMLHIASSLYFLVSIAFNTIVEHFLIFLIPFSVVGLAGVYIGIQLHRGVLTAWLRAASAIVCGLGFASSSYLFVLGLTVGGVVGPSWVLFLICGVLLWLSSKNA